MTRFIDELPGGSGGALIRGEAGIGKTVLWRAGVELARQAGWRVLVTRCVEAEMPLALGGFGDLFDGLLPEIAEELAEPQRRALAVAAGLEAATAGAPDRVALPRAFLAALRALAARTPVLLAIDDVQWLDPTSQRILAFAAGRLGDAPVGILATQRGDDDDPLRLRHAFEERLTTIRVGPLSVGALHHLIRSRLGLRIPRPMLARVHEASGGNPMFALEFAQVAASAGAPLPVPSSLEELVRERVAGLPPELLPLLAAVAAVERPTPSLLGAVIDDASELLDAASAAGAVTVGTTASSVSPIRCSHRPPTPPFRRRRGAPCTRDSPPRATTSRSARATSHSRSSSPTRRSRGCSTGRPLRHARAAPPTPRRRSRDTPFG